MNFIVKEKYHFIENVDIQIPGEKQKQRIIVEFRLLEKEFIEKIKNTLEPQAEIILKNAVIDIKGLVDEELNEIICEPQLKNRLLSLPFIAKPVLEKYALLAYGIAEKNLELPSDSKLPEKQNLTLN